MAAAGAAAVAALQMKSLGENEIRAIPIAVFVVCAAPRRGVVF
jgi:hypothetical protein